MEAMVRAFAAQADWEARCRQAVELGYKTQGLFPRSLSPLIKLCRLKLLQPSDTVTSGGGQVHKHRTLCGTFHFKGSKLTLAPWAHSGSAF